MRRHALLLFCATVLYFAPSAQPAFAEVIHFNTDTGVMTIDGSPQSNFFGVPMQTSVVGGIQQFRFLGGITFISTDVVNASGSRPLSLWGGDNIDVQNGAAFNFDVIGPTGKLGGGNGTAAVSGGSAGTGGNGYLLPIIGGAGGAGGSFDSVNIFPGDDGGTGSAGQPGSIGTPGSTGSAGIQGGAGFNNSAGVRAAGVGGSSGSGGSPGATGTGGGGGSGGDDGSPQGLGEDGGAGNTGGTGGVGGIGGQGGAAGHGLGGLNNITGLILSGGAGGGSGGGGGGGGGGAGGSAGGGGGGGGGGGAGSIIVPEAGAGGGLGGFGGNGGKGGNGAIGQGSGRGGAGGAAVEIFAQGRLNFAGSISARGASALARPSAATGQNGSAGSAGTVGFSGGSSTTGLGGDGGVGGQGGTGGTGGKGGNAGPGGEGGGGAGGTIMFKSSLFSAEGATISATGGPSNVSFGGNGRYVVSDNGEAEPNYGTRTNVNDEFFIGQAARDINPLIQGSVNTFNIAGLAGGADVYGVMNGVSVTDSFFDDVRANAPLNAVAALIRSDVGPTGDNYYGQEHLLLVNLTTSSLASPVLGIGPTGEGYQSSLLERGFSKNPAFGGSGPDILTALPAESVYATLVPNDLTDYEVFAYAGSSLTVSWDTLGVAYLSTTSGDFDQDGDVDGRDFLKWQRGESTNPFSAGDLEDWQTNYGFNTLTATSTAVPEPGSLFLVCAFLAVLPAYGSWRRI